MPKAIMVVDDERSICDVLREALHCIQEGRVFDVVISDIQMPGVDGLTLLEEIHRRHPKTKVILVTGFASSQVASEAMERGAYTYLYKPFHLPQLLSTVRQALEGPSEETHGAFELIGESAPCGASMR